MSACQSVCERGNSKAERTIPMKFDMWHSNQNCRFLSNLGQNPPKESLSIRTGATEYNNCNKEKVLNPLPRDQESSRNKLGTQQKHQKTTVPNGGGKGHTLCLRSMGLQHHSQTTETPVSIQRNFQLNITGAYNTTPTAALHVIEGLMPFYIKAKMQSTLAHIGIKGHETADTLAKEATGIGTPANTFPESYLKKQLLQFSLSLWQVEWANGESGRSVYNIIPRTSNKHLHWSREYIQFGTGHGPFASYLRRFGLHPTDYFGCGEIRNPIHYAKRCPLPSSSHHKEPNPQFIIHWWKSALFSKLTRRKIDNLIII
ncbi:hypothetical protein AVEN_76665-1 [Araneus ventricosus]|uniref:RNase H type-1 domain-containing protein n=1 Tax=Araneus ventricosus TaxID=182803 RepID=A0A4Y2BNZ9_ARAVE|nr:hypothetical protein AVEN_76665-1 [Araneus ventricosus]